MGIKPKIPPCQLIQKELQATTWLDCPIELVQEGVYDGISYYYYRQEWRINGIRVMTFRYKVNAKTLEVYKINTDYLWSYSHKLFDA